MDLANWYKLGELLFMFSFFGFFASLMTTMYSIFEKSERAAGYAKICVLFTICSMLVIVFIPSVQAGRDENRNVYYYKTPEVVYGE
jgi:hypothetical protein